MKEIIVTVIGIVVVIALALLVFGKTGTASKVKGLVDQSNTKIDSITTEMYQ